MQSVRRGITSRWLPALMVPGLLGIANAADADILIDDFTSIDFPNPWPVSQTDVGNILITEVNQSPVLGDVRQTSIFGVSFDSESDVLTTSILPLSGLLAYESTSGANGSLLLRYTGFPSGLNADFSNELGVLIDFSDLGYFGRAAGDGANMPVTVDIFDGTNSANLTETVLSEGAQSLFFEFNLFSGIGAMNMAAIDRITVFLNPGDDLDFKIDLIKTTTIPAPGVLALLGIAGLGSRRRRRR